MYETFETWDEAYKEANRLSRFTDGEYVFVFSPRDASPYVIEPQNKDYFGAYDDSISERQEWLIGELGGKVDNSMNRSKASDYIKKLQGKESGTWKDAEDFDEMGFPLNMRRFSYREGTTTLYQGSEVVNFGIYFGDEYMFNVNNALFGYDEEGVQKIVDELNESIRSSMRQVFQRLNWKSQRHDSLDVMLRSEDFGAEEVPEGFHRMPDGTIMADSAHVAESFGADTPDSTNPQHIEENVQNLPKEQYVEFCDYFGINSNDEKELSQFLQKNRKDPNVLMKLDSLRLDAWYDSRYGSYGSLFGAETFEANEEAVEQTDANMVNEGSVEAFYGGGAKVSVSSAGIQPTANPSVDEAFNVGNQVGLDVAEQEIMNENPSVEVNYGGEDMSLRESAKLGFGVGAGLLGFNVALLGIATIGGFLLNRD